MPDSENPHDQDPGSLGHFLVLAGIETLLNSAIALDASTVSALTQYEGTIIRLKIRQPYLVCYLIIDSAGIEVRDEYPGHSDIRITAGLLTIIRFFLGLPPQQTDYKIWGDPEQILNFRTIHRGFDLRTAFSVWLRNRINISEIVQRIRDQDSRWLNELTPVPGLIRDSMQQMKHMRQSLETHEQQLATMHRRLQQQRLVNLLLIAFCGGLLLSQGMNAAQEGIALSALLVVLGFLLSKFTNS